jgi:tape measure domain-containing protein
MNGLNLKLILEAVDRITAPVRSIKNKLIETFKAATSGANELAEAMNKAGRKAAQVGGFLTSRFSVPLLGLGALSLRSAGQVEELTMQMEHLAGGAEQARDFVKSLQSYIDRFGTDELAKSVQLLETAGYGTDEIRKRIALLGDVAAGSRTPLSALTDQYISLRKAGKVSDGDLDSMMRANIPVVQELAKQLGVSEKRVWNLAAKGKISFEQYRKAMVGLTEEGGRFNGAMERQSGSINGIFKELRNSIASVMADLGAGLWKDLDIAPKIKALSAAVRGLVEGFMGLPKWLKTGITWLALILATIGPVLMIVGQLTIGIAGLLFTFGKLPLILAATTKGMKSLLLINTVGAAITLFIQALAAGFTVMEAFNLVLLTNPIGLFITALLALGAAGYMLYKHWDAVKAFFGRLWDFLKKVFTSGIKVLVTALSPFLFIPMLIVKHWGAISSFFGGLWSGIKSVFQSSIEAVLGYLQPLIDAVNLIIGGLGRIGHGVGKGLNATWQHVTGEGDQPATAAATAAAGPVAPAMPRAARGGKLDAGGTIKIVIDQNNRAKVAEVRSNDSRMKYKPPETGTLMGGF